MSEQGQSSTPTKSDIAARIRELRGEKVKAFERDANVAKRIREHLDGEGNFYHNNAFAYFFNENEKRLVEIGKDSLNFTLLMNDFGINKSEKLFDYVVQDLVAYAFKHGAYLLQTLKSKMEDVHGSRL